MKKLGIVIVGFFMLGLVASIFEDDPESTKSSNSVESSDSTPVPTLPPSTTTTVPLVSKTQLNAALSKSRITTDDVEGRTWYRAMSSPVYTNRNGFFLYIGQGDGTNPYLRFRIQYYGEDWLFIDSFLINIDGVKYEINTGYGDIERDNDSRVWEWYDVNPTSSDLAMLQAISKSKKTVVRLKGDKYHKDVVLTTAQKQALKTMFTVYRGLGGTLTTY